MIPGLSPEPPNYRPASGYLPRHALPLPSPALFFWGQGASLHRSDLSTSSLGLPSYSLDRALLWAERAPAPHSTLQPRLNTRAQACTVLQLKPVARSRPQGQAQTPTCASQEFRAPSEDQKGSGPWPVGLVGGHFRGLWAIQLQPKMQLQKNPQFQHWS